EFIPAVAADKDIGRTARRLTLDARPARGEVEFARGGEHGVTNLLSLQTTDGESPEETIRRVDNLGIDRRGFPRRDPGEGDLILAGSCGGIGRLAESGRKQNLPLKPFDAPAVGNELCCQPVEQFRMRRFFAETAEVAARRD